jgi:hypothetical protein
MHGSCESVRIAMESQAIHTNQDVPGWTLSVFKYFLIGDTSEAPIDPLIFPLYRLL